ncbi:MAG: outer membrane lipid asymmetry maintenance protein MlaD [Myxococcales bacterium]|nr:outer membrane lipid asymmetry maintenance protein MlaD [Myxococcales bacterium]
MESYSRTEVAVGFFVMLGVLALGYLSVSIGGATLWPTNRYRISARFASVGDLSAGAVVKLAGVAVGDVESIAIDRYAAKVSMRIDRSLLLPADTIASVKTEGLLGEAYVSLSPGAADANLKEGDRISQTEPPLDLFELVEKYAFEREEPSPSTVGATAPAGRSDAGAPSPFPDLLE